MKTATAAIASVSLAGCGIKSKNAGGKIILSFYLDDTSPGIAKAEAYKEFLEFCESNGVKGESSVILGYSGKSMAQDPDENQDLFLAEVRKSYEKGIDSHIELMTHHGLYDFVTGAMKETGIHEGLWLHEASVSSEEYYRYFSNILAEGEKAGIKYTGLTWPGCGCEACTKRYDELRKEGPLYIGNAALDALLRLAKEGKFRGRVIPIFYDADETNFGVFRKAADGKYGVYDMMPNAMDQFGIWENSAARVNPDYYISDDGKSGIIRRHLEAHDPYCMWYMHYQGVNPEKGLGWAAFKTVVGRIQTHLSDQVIWMRPSDVVTAYHDAGGWSFTENL
ncbi:MAG TPA: hypothetical protein VI583_07910 [Cyclobacteriaceae bacterium]|nr:hypothetical protein [Cyclobacteriaceae bacterium]